MSDSPQIRIELLSNPLLLAGARDMISAVARRVGFSEAACGQMALAVDEALCNVIRHGYARRTDKPIWISVTALGGLATPDAFGTDEVPATPNGVCPTTGIKIVIEDEAKQVDPSVIKGRPLEEIRPGGLGVHIIHEIMDQVQYEQRQGKGMRLIMIKTKASDVPRKGAAPEDKPHA